MRIARAAAALTFAMITATLLVSCVSSGSLGREIVGDPEREIRARGLSPDEVIFPQRLSLEAHAWLAAHRSGVNAGASDREQLQALLEALLGPAGLKILYDKSFTGTAEEVFASRRGNCLGFVNLFIGMSREIGIPAYYLAVHDASSFDREGDLVVVADHVAAGFGPPKAMLILDFEINETPTFEQVEPLSDLQALARYYSNRGAEELRFGKPEAALDWLEKSVVLVPDLATAWANLGVARRRNLDPVGAEEAYRQALELDPRETSAYHNYAALLRLRGDHERARELMALTDRLDNRNPYNYLNLGDWSLETGNLVSARRFFRRALSLAPDEAEPYAALGEVEATSGHRRKALRWLRRASQLDPAQPRVQHLEELLASTS